MQSEPVRVNPKSVSGRFSSNGVEGFLIRIFFEFQPETFTKDIFKLHIIEKWLLFLVAHKLLLSLTRYYQIMDVIFIQMIPVFTQDPDRSISAVLHDCCK